MFLYILHPSCGNRTSSVAVTGVGEPCQSPKIQFGYRLLKLHACADRVRGARLYVPLDACIRQLRHTFQATTLSDNHLLIHESDLLELSVLTEEVVPSRPTLLSLPTSLAKLDSRYPALFRGESTGNRTGRDSEKSRKSYLSRYVKCKTSGVGSFPRIHMVKSFSFIMHHVQKRLLATGILQFDRMRIDD